MIDFQNASFFKLKPVSDNDFAGMITPIFVPGEQIIQSFGNYGSNIHFCDDMKINAKGYEFFETTLAMKQR